MIAYETKRFVKNTSRTWDFKQVASSFGVGKSHVNSNKIKIELYNNLR